MGLELVVRPFVGRSIAPERVPTPQQKPQENVQVRVACSGSKPMLYSWWTVAEFKVVDGSHSEIARKTEVVRVRNPEDPEQYVDIERVRELTMRDDNDYRSKTRYNYSGSQQ